MKDIGLALALAALLVIYVIAEVVGNIAEAKVSQRAFLVRLASVVGLMFVAAGLAGCQSPAVRDRVVEVKVPVAVRPIAAKDVPQLPKPLPPRPSSLSAAADLLLGKVCEWVAYGVRSDPLLKVSAGQPQQAVPPYPECER